MPISPVQAAIVGQVRFQPTFSKDFLDIGDDNVSKRYHYGELQLTRLNLYTKLIIGRFHASMDNMVLWLASTVLYRK